MKETAVMKHGAHTRATRDPATLQSAETRSTMEGMKRPGGTNTNERGPTEHVGQIAMTNKMVLDGGTKTELGETTMKLGGTITELGGTKTELGETTMKLGGTTTELGGTTTKIGNRYMKGYL